MWWLYCVASLMTRTCGVTWLLRLPLSRSGRRWQISDGSRDGLFRPPSSPPFGREGRPRLKLSLNTKSCGVHCLALVGTFGRNRHQRRLFRKFREIQAPRLIWYLLHVYIGGAGVLRKLVVLVHLQQCEGRDSLASHFV
jgi:hypothetical protein